MYRANHGTYYVDALDIETSNFCRWINCARNIIEENLVARQCKGKIFYQAKRNIYPGEELLVYYGEGYARKLDIDVDNYYERKQIIKPFFSKVYQGICHRLLRLNNKLRNDNGDT